ncbi:MAG: xanthine dehydrogenase [Salinisphaeraceae bacterium]|nr:xanthine dehydrogenase [Salinisphaeraceae bacterium]
MPDIVAQTPAPPAASRSARRRADQWSVGALESDVLPTIEQWQAAGHGIAMATLVDIRGSSPRPLGSEMAINDVGDWVGYVSGGCVEAEVASRAQSVLESGEPCRLRFGKGSPLLDIQLACGGGITILIWRLDTPQRYLAARKQAHQRRSAVDLCLNPATGRYVMRAPQDDVQTGATLFRKRYVPPPRLILVGRDPVTIAACQMAPALGFEVSLICPYGPRMAPPGCPPIHYDNRRLALVLRDLQLDAYTALYTLTHDLADDHAVVSHGLASEAFVVGALGSRRKATRRRALLAADGFDNAAIARLDCPAGVNIGAREPREIALSIISRAVQSRAHDEVLPA